MERQSSMSLSSAHSNFYRSLFSELASLVKRWGSLDDESLSHFATLANISSRIQLIQQNPNDLGVLLQFEKLPEQMVRSQFNGLEASMQTLRTA